MNGQWHSTVGLPWTGIKHLRLLSSDYRHFAFDHRQSSHTLGETLSCVAQECQLKTLELELYSPLPRLRDVKSVLEALFRVRVSSSITLTALHTWTGSWDDRLVDVTRDSLRSYRNNLIYNITVVPQCDIHDEEFPYLAVPRFPWFRVGRWVLLPKVEVYNGSRQKRENVEIVGGHS